MLQFKNLSLLKWVKALLQFTVCSFQVEEYVLCCWREEMVSDILWNRLTYQFKCIFFFNKSGILVVQKQLLFISYQFASLKLVLINNSRNRMFLGDYHQPFHLKYVQRARKLFCTRVHKSIRSNQPRGVFLYSRVRG